jgi:hypothetical protein
VAWWLAVKSRLTTPSDYCSTKYHGDIVVRYNGGGNFSQVSVAVVNGNPNQITGPLRQAPD